MWEEISSHWANKEAVLEVIGKNIYQFYEISLSGFGANTYVFLAGFVYAIRQFNNQRKTRENSDFAALLNRNSEINKRNDDDPNRRNALEIYFEIFNGPHTDLDENSEEFKVKYWGCRTFFADLIGIVFQAWLISGRSRRFAGKYEGFELVASKVAKEIFFPPSNKPNYYCKACKDISIYIHEGRFYSPNFSKKIRLLSK